VNQPGNNTTTTTTTTTKERLDGTAKERYGGAVLIAATGAAPGK
jgi:hypothetical protein